MKIKNNLYFISSIIFGINFTVMIIAAFATFTEYNSTIYLLIFHNYFTYDIASLIIYFGLINTYPFYSSFGGFFLIFGLCFYIPSTILFITSGFTDKIAFIKTGFKIALLANLFNIFGGGLGLWMYIQNTSNIFYIIHFISPILILSTSIINISLQSLLFSYKEETISLVNLSVEKLSDILQFCSNCGNSLTKLDKFCSRCGLNISKKMSLGSKNFPNTK